MPLAWPNKDPNEVLDYSVDWSARLVDSDTIATSTWEVPTGLTEDSNTFTDTVATIWLSGGTVGESYLVLNRVTTAGGRTMDQTVKLRVKEK